MTISIDVPLKIKGNRVFEEEAYNNVFEESWRLAKNDLREMQDRTAEDGDRAIEKHWKAITGTSVKINPSGYITVIFSDKKEYENFFETWG